MRDSNVIDWQPELNRRNSKRFSTGEVVCFGAMVAIVIITVVGVCL